MDVEMLIEQVRRYPALYDRRNDKYKNTEYREMAWKKIAEDLQIEDGPIACKTKWIHIRDQFRKSLKKRKTATDMASSNVRKYRYADKLQFVLPQMSERETLSNISLSQEHAEDMEEESDSTFNNEEPNKEMSSNEDYARTSSSDNPKNDSLVKPVQIKRKKTDMSTMFDNSPSSQLISFILEEKKNEKQKGLDPVDAFLSGISHTLKTLNPLLLNEAKTKIFSVVQELEVKQILESQSRVS